MENAARKNSSSPTPLDTKLCHIIKRPDFEGYGFNLHSEKIKPGQFIGKVDKNSPAEAAGLKEGDRIIEVNSVLINNESHKQVVQRIKAISNEVRLLLVDVDAISANYNIDTNHNNNESLSTNTESLPSKKSESNSKTETNVISENIENNKLDDPIPRAVPFKSANSETMGNLNGLQLSMTAAEMRAKLLSRKKYDPKTDTVDLKKKFEIIQKL